MALEEELRTCKPTVFQGNSMTILLNAVRVLQNNNHSVLCLKPCILVYMLVYTSIYVQYECIYSYLGIEAMKTSLWHVRLASAGSMLTAVALELVAGKTWAAGLTRKPGAGLDRYSTTRGFQLEEPPAAFGRRGRLGCPRPRKSHTDSTDGILVTRGRGCRPRVGPPLGHPGPVSRQTEQDEEEHVAAVSGRAPRTALHGVTGTARLRRVEGSLRKPGRPGG